MHCVCVCVCASKITSIRTHCRIFFGGGGDNYSPSPYIVNTISPINSVSGYTVAIFIYYEFQVKIILIAFIVCLLLLFIVYFTCLSFWFWFCFVFVFLSPFLCLMCIFTYSPRPFNSLH